MTFTGACINITVTTTGIFNISQNTSDIWIFPNPVDNILFIRAPMKDYSCRISDVNGRVIYEKNSISSGFIEIDAREWNKGVYFIQIRSEKVRFATKFLKH
jgi:hypothetical protein